MRSNIRFIALLAAIVVGYTLGTSHLHLAGLGAASADKHSGASSSVPAQISVVPHSLKQAGVGVEASGAPTTSTDALISRYQAAVRSAPRNISGYLNLSMAYAQKERETTDVTYYTLTDQTLQKALQLDPRNYAAINQEAWVALGRHDFVTARALAREAILLNPHDPANYGNLGDADANLGDYAGMARAYQRMVNLRPGLPSYNRASYARWLYGDERGATRFMLMAIRAGSTEPENVAWCQTQLGDDLFNEGFTIAAQQQYQAALQTFPHYARALAGLGSVQAALGYFSSAARYYRQAIAVVPLPQYVIALGDLEARMGNSRTAAREYALIHFMNHIFALNHVRFDIEMAQFDADHNQHLGEALRIARQVAKTRHDSQTEDTLAWVLYKNGRYAEAWHAEQAALRLGTHYAPFYFHAGMIQAKLGSAVEAQSYLSEALMVNPQFSVLYAPVGRAELASLGQQVAFVAKHPHEKG